MSTYIDIHIVQSLPPSYINRDNSGSPKSAVYGDVRRLRVPSRSWKRATHLYFNDLLDADGVGARTKRVVEVLAEAITKDTPELAENTAVFAKGVFKAAKVKVSPPCGKKDGAPESGYLLFLSTSQITHLAKLVIVSARSGEVLDAKMVKKIFKEEHAIGIALFRRMVAEDTDLNVDAACQVAHTISTHTVENEYDFFTAVNDKKNRSEEEDAGTDMIGTVEFSSATVYCYATVNLNMLAENLGDGDAALRALEIFIKGFYLSMPTGKQNMLANRTLLEAIVVSIHGDQPVPLVGAFGEPVPESSDHGYVERSMGALAQYTETVEKNYGLRPLSSFIVALKDSDAVSSFGEHVFFADLPDRVRQAVALRTSREERA